jgi:hypothetical protein
LRRRTSAGSLKPQPFLRVTDVNTRLAWDLASMHDLPFITTQKDDLDQQINAVRVAVSKQQILIHPRCKKLRDDLKNGVWKNLAKKVFDHDSKHGHYDTIAALIYMWRNVHQRRNPAPREEQYVIDARAADQSGRSIAQGPRTSKWSRRGFKYRVR